jgi:uncharacterized protein (DUF1800 family)
LTNYGVTNSGSGDVTVSNSVVGQGNVVGDGNAVATDAERIEHLATEVRALLTAQADRLEHIDEIQADFDLALAEIAARRPRTARALLDRVHRALAGIGAFTGPVSELLAIAGALHGAG